MIIGIDLGTTNSLAAIWTDGKPQIVPNALGHHLTPSVVGIDDNGDILVGMAARERLLTHPQLTAALFKRYMGSNRTITLGKRAFRSEELSSLVLRSLKADVEAKIGKPVTEAVITVPAYFSDAQRKATKIAGQLAGLSVERLLNEPTAAALAYGLHQTSAESKFLVFDLGGGTFDVSILELFDGVMEVHASAGDNFLGGEDFVDRIIDAFIDAVGKAAGIPPRTQLPASFHQALRDQAERAKRHLSEDDSATLSVQWKGQPITWTITTEQFATLSAPLLQRLRVPVERALRDARIRAAELNEVILVGGATRKPIIRKLVAQMFGRLPARHVNPEEAVALGAAVQAGLKMRDAALNEVVLTDVCPYSLGIEVAEMISPNNFQSGFYLPVIERNTVVPTSRSKNVSTVQNNQRQILVKIFQGESRLVKDNIFLGEISVPVPPKRAGEESIDVRFTYDINGLLEVEVQVASTGKKQQMIIEENPGVLRPSEIERRLQELAALKIHPRDQAENRTLLARADRLYEQSLGELRAFLAEQINRFQIIIERQDQREISEARAMLSASLDEIEGDSYL